MAYIKLPVNEISFKSILPYNIYLERPNRKIVLYRSEDYPIQEKDVQRLKKDYKYVLIEKKFEKKHYEALEGNLLKVLGDKGIPVHRRTEIAKKCTDIVIEQTVHNPKSIETVQRTKNIVKNIISFILRNSINLKWVIEYFENFEHIRHTRNVTYYSIILARECGVSNYEFVNKVATVAILHDLGRAKIRSDITEFDPHISNADKSKLHRHPLISQEIIKKSKLTSLIQEEDLTGITQHHERLDGSGYPQCLSHFDLGPLPRMISIIDQFDILTQKNGHHPGMLPFDALTKMVGEKEKYDERILKSFINALDHAPESGDQERPPQFC